MSLERQTLNLPTLEREIVQHTLDGGLIPFALTPRYSFDEVDTTIAIMSTEIEANNGTLIVDSPLRLDILVLALERTLMHCVGHLTAAQHRAFQNLKVLIGERFQRSVHLPWE